MKLLILIMLLTGCSPKFKEGDCITSEDANRWEIGNEYEIFKILEVGKSKYRTEPSFMYDKIQEIDSLYIITECPKKVEPCQQR